MSGTAAGLRRKIRVAEDLQSVVRTMKAVAVSGIGQYEKSVAALADSIPKAISGKKYTVKVSKASSFCPVHVNLNRYIYFDKSPKWTVKKVYSPSF